jgi:branched-chain amino acid transport system substrate-binding protein
MKRQLKLAGLAVLLSAAAGQAVAQEKLKIGVIVTLTGPAAALGQQVRDGFTLAVKDLGGKMAGREVEVVAVDDELKPDGAVTKVKGLLERDKVDFVVGPIFSNILQAIHKPVTDSKTFLISPNAGPSSYAGKSCSPFFYVTSYQNDQVHEILGKVAQDRGYKRVYLLVPNYQAGRDSVAGFKLDYKGEIVEETYMPLGSLDFQVELSKIASLKPDAVFTFMPGGMGVSLVKQYRQAGLADQIPVLSAFTVDESTLPAQQDAAVGMFGGSNWAPNLDNPQNKKFVAAYEAAYNSVPGTYAFQAYDAAMLIDSAVKAGRPLQQGSRDGRIEEGRLHLAARRFQVQYQRLSDPGLLPDQGRQTRGRQIPDRDRPEGVRELRRPLRQGLHAGQLNNGEGNKAMKSEITGITRANEGMQGISWNILGQTYVPKNCTDHCFSWHATMPPGTFVPPHIHPDQDEYLYMLEGKLDFMLAGADAQATPGDLIRLGMGVPHGIFNKSDQTAKVLFWVSPSQKLYDLFWGLHNMKEQKPEDVVAMAAEFNIHFLPPPPGA